MNADEAASPTDSARSNGEASAPVARLPAIGRKAAAVAVLLMSSLDKYDEQRRAGDEHNDRHAVQEGKAVADPQRKSGSLHRLRKAQSAAEQDQNVEWRLTRRGQVKQEGAALPAGRNDAKRDDAGDGDACVIHIDADEGAD